ncbi:MAG: caspase family protein [Burkholderiaceae bacterium]|nr:caspase family protein [Burkholderiaceae bacterium]
MNTRRKLSVAALLGTLALTAAAQAPSPALPAERNTRHALIIGIGEYADPQVPKLEGVVHDMDSARRMARAMAVPEANMRIVRDREATAARIRQEIAGLEQRMADGDRLFVYFSGHGTRWFDEATRNDGCTEGLLATDGQVLTNVEIGQRLAPITRRADKVLVFYDACFSGGVAGEPFRTRSLAVDAARVTPKFTRAGAPEACSRPSNFISRSLGAQLGASLGLAQNVVHIAASRPDEVSFDNSAKGGYATVAWRDCLLGQATDTDGSGAITVDEVTACAQARVNKGLEGQPGISGQRLTLAGNQRFVPAWMSAAFVTNVAAAVPAPAPAATPPVPAPAPAPAPALTPVQAPAATPAPPPPAPAPQRLATPAEILAELHAQRDGSHAVAARARQPQLKIGRDLLQLDITPARDGHLYVALAGSDGKSLHLLYPNALAQDTAVKAGRTLTLPGPGWEVASAGPAGTETLLVMVTDAPRDLSILAKAKAGPFMKTLLNPEGRSRLQAVLSNGTPSAGCGKPGRPACSDAFGAALVTVRSVE